MTKQVTIQIAAADLQILQNNGYALCCAKKVNNTYDVVWQSSTNYLQNNFFGWMPQYQVFTTTNQFMSGMQVSMMASSGMINLGQTVTLDANGNPGNPNAGGPAGAITVINNGASIFCGLSQFLNYIDGSSGYMAAYVAQSPVPSGGTIELAPVDSVLVWFGPNMPTGTEFGFSPPGAFEIDLSNTDQATLLFQGGQWIRQS